MGDAEMAPAFPSEKSIEMPARRFRLGTRKLCNTQHLDTLFVVPFGLLNGQ